MILNNCTTCGRKPKQMFSIDGAGYSEKFNHYMRCQCGKAVISFEKEIWSREVAADMWNRENPEPVIYIKEKVNSIAAELARAGVKVEINNFGELRLTGSIIGASVAIDCHEYEKELTEFYKQRLEPGVKA